MKRLVRAISEEIFDSWDKEKQNQWLEDHPNSKFKNLDEIKDVRNQIKDKSNVRMSDYAENLWQWKRESEQEDQELQQLNDKLKRLEKKPLHKFKPAKPQLPLDKYKIDQEGEPNFSKTLEPFVNFSKKTGIRTAEDLENYANELSKGYGFENYQAKQEYKKLADSLLNKYKGTVVHSSELDPNEKKLIQMLAVYKKEKAYYEENERKKESPEYKKFLEMRDNYERENRKLKPLIQEWYNAKGMEEKAKYNPNMSEEEKRKLTEKRARLGKELHNRRVQVDNLITETDKFEKENQSKFPNKFHVDEPIFGKKTIDLE